MAEDKKGRANDDDMYCLIEDEREVGMLAILIRASREIDLPELREKVDEYQAELSRLRRRYREKRKANAKVLRRWNRKHNRDEIERKRKEKENKRKNKLRNQLLFFLNLWISEKEKTEP